MPQYKKIEYITLQFQHYSVLTKYITIHCTESITSRFYLNTYNYHYSTLPKYSIHVTEKNCGVLVGVSPTNFAIKLVQV